MASEYFYNVFDFATAFILVFVVVRFILSWVPSLKTKETAFIWEITEPLLRPLRKLGPQFGKFDLSPIYLVILLEALRSLILR